MHRRVLVTPALLLPVAAHAAPSLDVYGWCPEITVTLAGATPNRQVMVFTGDPGGTTTLTGGPCDGATIDLGGANERQHQLVTTRTSATGGLVFAPASVNGNDCADGSVQAIDLTTCEVSDVVPLQIDCKTLALGLVAHWSGDGNTGDLVGGHHGATEGTVNYVPGVRGDAFEFDGASAVKIGPAADLEFVDGEPFTWGMWIHQDRSGSQHLFGKRHSCLGGGTFDYQMYIAPAGGASHWGPDSCAAFISGEPTVGKWQYLVGMYDGARFDLYLDGELVSTSGDCVGDVMAGHGAAFRIGRSGTCSGWVGLVDEVKLWDRALQTDEILCASREP
jgi:hypothetical protein